MKIEILHVRDPDNECDVQVWMDGVLIPFSVISYYDVDPGRGYERSDWDENIAYVKGDDLSEGFRAAALEAYESNANSEFIS